MRQPVTGGPVDYDRQMFRLRVKQICWSLGGVGAGVLIFQISALSIYLLILLFPVVMVVSTAVSRAAVQREALSDAQEEAYLRALADRSKRRDGPPPTVTPNQLAAGKAAIARAGISISGWSEMPPADAPKDRWMQYVGTLEPEQIAAAFRPKPTPQQIADDARHKAAALDAYAAHLTDTAASLMDADTWLAEEARLRAALPYPYQEQP